ncbi:MAG TPA: prepilin peptidase [bacterium]|nr:prepilin peptidase [bacterium]
MGLFFYGLLVSLMLGAALASFAHCWANRLYRSEGFSRRSYCPSCQKILSWIDNIPVFSYIFRRGKCAYCHSKIKADYIISEISGAIFLAAAFITSWFMMGGEESVWSAINDLTVWVIVLQALAGLTLLMLTFWSDYWWMSIFVRPLVGGSLFFLVTNLIIGKSWLAIMFGGLFGGLFFASQFLISKGRWVGEGDIYIGLFLGVWLGWPLIFPVIIFAYILGSVVAIGLLIVGKKSLASKLPMGVFLAPSAWFFYIYGNDLWQSYLKFLGW